MTIHGDSTVTVAIIGAGFGGIATAIALKRQLGFENFIIYEKCADVGGTWRDNTYPGASSDVPIHYYSLSSDLKDDWRNEYEYQPGILSYIKELVSKHALASHIAFNSKVVSAEWQADLQLYNITLEDTKSGARTTSNAQVIVSAHGVLHIPKMPSIPGLDSFKGQLLHSSQWDTSLDLSGKRVAVLGNGGSATQIIPNILKLEKINVTQFVRTQNWYLPFSNRPISDGWRWAFRYIPLLTRLYRISLFFKFELTYLSIFKSAMLRSKIMKRAKRHMLETCPKKYQEQLIPSYPLGCRRILYDVGYLDALHRPNMTLRQNDIEAIVDDGIVTKDGEKLPFDVIVCATGFVIETFPFVLRGTGPTIQQFYEDKAGPEAYLGTVFPEFPNFYMLSGPNTTTGYTSVLFFNEIQLKYIMTMIKPVIEQSVSSFELTPEANREYNNKIQARSINSVFTLCTSWYRLNKDGKVITAFPGSCIRFWWWCRRVNWRHYKTVVADASQQSVQRKRTMQKTTSLRVSATLIVFLALAVWKIRRL